jgi:hypothetical protein
MINTYTGSEMTPQESLDVNRFTWNSKCSEAQLDRMNALREAGKDLCQLIISCAPNSADRSSAIRHLRTAIMECNLAIAHEAIK